MNFIKIAAVLIFLQLISGCKSPSAQFGFKSSDRNDSSQNSFDTMKVFIDASGMGTAGSSIKDIAKIHNDASLSLVKSFNTKLNETGVKALIKPFGAVTSTVTVDSKKTTTITLRSQGVTTEKMLEGESSNALPILIVRIYSTQAQNYTWNGMVSWSAELVDPSIWSNNNKVSIWTAETIPMQFGPTYCSGDAYKSCADKLAEVVIAQLRREKLIK